jgi:hypothetical protein
VNDYMLRSIARDIPRRLSGRCTVTRGTWPNVETVAEDVPCAFRPSLVASAEVGSGGRQYGLHMYDGTLHTAADIRRGDVCTFTRSRDARMVGRWLTVREATIDEYLASRKVVAEESVA